MLDKAQLYLGSIAKDLGAGAGRQHGGIGRKEPVHSFGLELQLQLGAEVLQAAAPTHTVVHTGGFASLGVRLDHLLQPDIAALTQLGAKAFTGSHSAELQSLAWRIDQF